MIGQLGGFFGWVIVVLFAIAVLNYVVKLINRKYLKKISKYDTVKKYYNFIMKNIVKYHKVIGIIVLLFLLAHFLIQYNNFGFNLTGAIAAIAMILEVALGIYGAYINKKRKGAWFITHRFIATILIVALFIHIVMK